MSIQMKIPPVGESITEVTVAEWHKKDGEFVEADEIICELESDKATFELNAEAAGILHTKANSGDTLAIGDVICEIDTEGTPSNSPKEDNKEEKEVIPSGKTEKTGEIIEMKIPVVGESITEVTLASRLKNDGDLVELDEPIAEIESDKATFELAAEARGILKFLVKEGESIAVGDLICQIEKVEGSAATVKTKPTEQIEPTASGDKSYATGHPSPAAAKILSEKDIDPKSVTGSGPGGRITKEDAQNAQKSVTPPVVSSETAAASVISPLARGERREKLSNLRKTIARRLVAVKNETAMLTTFNEVDMSAIMELRAKYKEKFKEKYEVGLGFMSFFTKAICTALQEWPAVNAGIDGDEIVYHDFCDISIAVSAPRGLVVPVIRNAESLTFDQIEKEIVRLATKARENKLSIEEMTGGTFTITNGGVFGSMMSTPIINAPQSAILGMHNIVQRPVAVNGAVEIRPMMYLALSYDHRIIDGRESVSFLVRVKQLLEDPSALLLGI